MRKEKEYLLEEIADFIPQGSNLVLINYGKMEPNVAQKFRKRISGKGGRYLVVKKRIFRKAAEIKGMKIDISHLKGHVGFVVAKDHFLETTKELYNFRTENKDLIEVLGGHYEGSFCSSSQVEMISKLPSLDEMRAQFLGTLEAPLSHTLGAIEAIITSVIYCLDNKAKDQQS
ncbi:MAG: 50S ribosomal protein L10 [Chlamydiia bacterium]